MNFLTDTKEFFTKLDDLLPRGIGGEHSLFMRDGALILSSVWSNGVALKVLFHMVDESKTVDQLIAETKKIFYAKLLETEVDHG